MQGLDPDLRALQEMRDLVARAHRAQKEVATWDQGRVDALCKAMAEAGEAAAHDLARVAVEETGIGRIHYKVLKNVFGSRGVWDSIKDERTCGVISRDERTGVVEVATPVGIVACIVPTTNPTSTALGKAMIAVKGRNAAVMSPHPRSRRCVGETVDVLRRAIERAGGPPDLVTSLSNPTIESTGALMKHPKTAIILATGGSGLVEAAYSSGKPAYGVGPGNVPCYVDRSADVRAAARWITSSQSFDNATLCCSEQALVLDEPIHDALLAEMVARGAHLCDEGEIAKLAAYCNHRGHMNPDIVGLDPWRVAEGAGFSVPRHTTVLLAPQGGVGRDWPLSIEILCPLLSVHRARDWEHGCEISLEVLRYGGLGHTISVWARDDRVIEAWFLEKPANRIVLNGPSSEGAVGYSTGLVPSMSLGCGPQAGNITSDNITAKHLINVKRASAPTSDWETRYERDHALAAGLTGDRAPRGSGLPGDPALGGAPAATSSGPVAPSSSWAGNPPVEAAASLRPAAPPAKATPAPTFTRPGGAATAAPPRPAAAPVAAPRPTGATSVGGALSAGEIQDLMKNAGAGCPMGPCQGCPHRDVRTGACQA